jgi:erythromycin esterase
MNGFNIRDRQMAKNLCWIANWLYPEKKIIVWAHNIHNMYNTSLAYPGYISMGEIMKTTSLSNHIYNIGFTSRNNYTCMWPQDTTLFRLSGPKKKFIELYFPENEFYFLELKKHNNQNLYSKRFRSYLTLDGITHKWFQGFDGIFYIKTLHPSSFK